MSVSLPRRGSVPLAARLQCNNGIYLSVNKCNVWGNGAVCVCVCVYRQPPSVHLFPSGSGFVAVSEAVLCGVSSSCLLVATEAATTASALFRYTQTHILYCRYINESHIFQDTLSCDRERLFFMEICKGLFFSVESFQTFK